MIDQGSLELLVDGELTDTEQREVLLRLDREPQGWRALSLAFVEAQRWRKELQALIADTERQALRPFNPPPAVKIAKPVFRPFGRSMLAVVCALAVLSFAAGHFVGTRGLSREGSHTQAANASSELDAARHRAPSPGESRLAADVSAHAEAHSVSETEAAAAKAILVEVPDSDSVRYTVVPLVDAALGIHVARNAPRVIPDDLQNILERYGFEVIENRQFTPVRLLDGRRAIMVSTQAKVRRVERAVF